MSSRKFKRGWLPQSQELPHFRLSSVEIGTEPHVLEFDVGLVEFVRGMLSGELRWERDYTESEYDLYYVDDACWKCARQVRQIYGYGIDVYGDAAKTVPNASKILQDIAEIVTNDELRQLGLNIIESFERYRGADTRYPYMNACLHCGAPQSNYHLLEKMHAQQRRAAETSVPFCKRNPGLARWRFAQSGRSGRLD